MFRSISQNSSYYTEFYDIPLLTFVLLLSSPLCQVPLEGFGSLQGMRGVQRFSIHKAYGDSGLLPTAHTCFNQVMDCHNAIDHSILTESLINFVLFFNLFSNIKLFKFWLFLENNFFHLFSFSSCLSVFLFFSFSFYMFIYLFIYLFIHLFIYLFIFIFFIFFYFLLVGSSCVHQSWGFER